LVITKTELLNANIFKQRCYRLFMGNVEDEIKRFILRKLVRHRMWMHKHTSIHNLAKGLPDYIRSRKEVRKVIDEVIKQLKKVNVKITIVPKITVQNIVASGTINLQLNLNYLALEMENTEYEPEQFPGLVYKLEDSNATFLLFSNGKLVCTGTKNKQQLEDSMTQLLKNIKAILKNYKK